MTLLQWKEADSSDLPALKWFECVVPTDAYPDGPPWEVDVQNAIQTRLNPPFAADVLTYRYMREAWWRTHRPELAPDVAAYAEQYRRVAA